MNSITLSALAGFPEQLEAHYAAIPAEYKYWAPPSWEGAPSEPFTAIEQICHILILPVIFTQLLARIRFFAFVGRRLSV